MRRASKIILWCVGCAILIYLIKVPVKTTDFVANSWSLPLSGKTIVIDPGHGGPDGGAVGKDETTEKDIVLDVAKKVRDYLQQAGAFVHLTRESDVDLANPETEGLSNRKSEDIRNRLQLIHDKKADFFISIHLNAIPSTVWSVAQTFYYPKYDESRHLAQMIQAQIIHNLENTTRAALAINGIYLLKYAKVPGTLIELGFLSNEEERDNLKTETYQQQMAASIYEGVLRYVTEDVEKGK